MNIGFTGTRHGMTPQQHVAVYATMRELLHSVRLREAINLESIRVFAHHGDCVGADAQFHGCARRLSLHIVGHLPVDETHRAFCSFDETREPLTHMRRNKQIVTAADIMIAAPFEAEEQQRGGTWKTIGMTRKAKKPLALVLPDGTVNLERWP